MHPVPSSSKLVDPSEPPSLPPVLSLADITSADGDVPFDSAPPATSSILASDPPTASVPASSTTSIPLASPPLATSRIPTASLPTLTHAESFIAEREDEGLLPLRSARAAKAAGRFGVDLSARGAREVHDELSNQLADVGRSGV